MKNYKPVKICFGKVVAQVSEEISYFLADVETFASRHVLAPVADTDFKMLLILWNEASAWLASELSDCISVEMLSGTRFSDTSLPSPSLLLDVQEVIGRETHNMICETACRVLAARMAAGWIVVANHLSDSHLYTRAERALLSLKTMLRPKASLFPRARISPHPF